MHEIRAEITASVWQVRVEVGQRVAADDELMILESMKMEIPVGADVAGVVEAILVAQGASVREGDVLAHVRADAS